MAVGDTKRRSDIKAQEQKDRTEKQEKVADTKKVGDDSEKVDSADKSTSFIGTEEGAQEAMSSMGQALNECKSAHQQLDGEAKTLFTDIQGVETDLQRRSESMQKDMQTIQGKLSEFHSKHTDAAKERMRDAAAKADEDNRFLADGAKQEQDIREEGESEMKAEADRISRLKIGRG